MGSASVTPLVYIEVDPIRALVRSAVVNDLKLVPIMSAMVLVGQLEELMCKFTIGPCRGICG